MESTLLPIDSIVESILLQIFIFSGAIPVVYHRTK